MRTIETNIFVTPGGHLSGEVPTDIPPGEHRAVLVIDLNQVDDSNRRALEFNPYNLGLVSDEMTLRREDIYDDFGR